MKRLALIVACSGLLLAGCGGAGDEKPAAQPKRKPGSQQAKTPIVRSLLGAIDEVEGEDQEVKQELKRTLREADEELSRVLGKNSRRLIEKANKRAPAPTIGPTAKPTAEAEAP